MKESEFVFELVDMYTPETVIRKLLEQVKAATRGYVTGEIQEYSGEITSYSYTQRTGLVSALHALQTESRTVQVNIQDELGEQDGEDHRYEVFLRVKGLEHYKYRMMFVDYGTVSYPVTVVMNEDLAIEYSGKRNPIFIITSMKDLEDMINKILTCKTILLLIQNLINEAIRQENKNIPLLEKTE